MKRLNIIFLVAFCLGLISPVLAGEKKDKSINPDSPVVATWSKIKELFE